MSLQVIVDGVEMPEAEARAFWARFSAHMEDKKGDLAGFAKAEGLASVRPTLGRDGPLLLASRVEPQTPYTKAGSKPGSPPPQARPAAKKKKPGKHGKF